MMSKLYSTRLVKSSFSVKPELGLGGVISVGNAYLPLRSTDGVPSKLYLRSGCWICFLFCKFDSKSLCTLHFFVPHDLGFNSSCIKVRFLIFWIHPFVLPQQQASTIPQLMLLTAALVYSSINNLVSTQCRISKISSRRRNKGSRTGCSPVYW